ncbi:MAG: secretin N-terminal domain-containing protein [bacterium]
MFNLKQSFKKSLVGGRIMVKNNRTQIATDCQDKIMVRCKMSLGLVCLLAIGVLADTLWATMVYSEEIPIQLEIKNSKDDINLRIINDQDDLTISNIYKFQNISAEELVDFISSSLSDDGSFAVLKDQRAVLITDLPSKVNSIIEALKQLDKQRTSGNDGIENYFYRFQNISVTSVIPFINQRLSSKGKVICDNTLNTIMISDIPSKIIEIKEIIKNVDILSEQVEIGVTVMEVIYAKGKKVGIDWNHIFEFLSFNTSGRYYQESWNEYSKRKEYNNIYERWEDTLRKNFDINIRNISVPLSLSDFINLLVSKGSAKIKATPRISILNNQTGELDFTDKIYYIPQSTYEKIETSKDVGLTLQITPQITTTGLIKLTINTDYNTLNGFTNQNQPIITSRKTNTTVILKDGQPFFISGLMKEDKVFTEKKVPIIGSIPIIGYFFKRKISQDTTREIVITLTPKIIKI